MRIRQRRVSRKVKASRNRAKAGIVVAKLHRKIAQQREAYQNLVTCKVPTPNRAFRPPSLHE